MQQHTRKLADVRQAIASACSAYTEDGSAQTVDEREAANANRRSLYAQLDARRIELDTLMEAAESTARDGDDGGSVDTAKIKVKDRCWCGGLSGAKAGAGMCRPSVLLPSSIIKNNDCLVL